MWTATGETAAGVEERRHQHRKHRSQSFVVAARLLSRCFFAELLLRAHIHTQDYPVVCLVLKSSNAHNGILSARRDVLARSANPLLSRRRSGCVCEWDESYSSEQDCGCRAHEVRYQCDS